MASTGHFTLNYTSAFDDANYGLNSGLGLRIQMMQIQIEVDNLFDLKNGGTVNTVLHS